MENVAHGTQANHEEIAAYVTPVNHLLHAPAIAQMWNPTTAAGRAALDAVITQQATLIAYIDDFKLMMMVVVVGLPLLLLLRKPRPVPTAAAAE